MKIQQGFWVIGLIILNCLFGQAAVSDVSDDPYSTVVPSATFISRNSDERIGYSISGAGDVNGDGHADFMVAEYHNYVHGWNSGGVYLVLGSSKKETGQNINIEHAAGAIFRGSQEYDMVGYNVAGKGDFNGDGLDDLLIGAPGHWDRNPATPGWAYIVFGKRQADWGKDYLLTSHANVKLIGEADLDQFGYANSFVGDINHDGFDDIICAAAYRNQGAKWSGKVYLILGDSTGWSERDPISKKAAASFIYPYNEAVTGYSVAGVGDVNQDGTPEFVIGVPGANMACLIFGRPNVDWGQNFNLANADYKFIGETEGDYAGSFISAANDVNDDGFPDFLVSAIRSFFNGGRIYLVCGRKNWGSREVGLSSVDASFRGEDVETHTGFSTSGLVDYDGDGFDDFLIGARYLNGPYPHSGKLYLIKGKQDGWQHDYNLEKVPDYFWGDDTITCAGWQVADVGDINGDSAHDFVTSGPFNSTGAHWGGKIYLFYGNNIKCQVRGMVKYYSHQSPVPGVQLALTGAATDSSFTTEAGGYSFVVPPNQNFMITPSKVLAQNSDDYVVSAYDAALAARHAMKIDILNDYFFIAADVDQDQSVTMYDAAQIARFAVDLPALDGSRVGTFGFDPQRRHYQQTQGILSNEDYTALVMGDVDGNWTQKKLRRIFDIDNSLLLPEKIFAHLNSEIEIPIRVSSKDSLLSVDARIAYDPSHLLLLDVATTELSSHFQLVHNTLSEGITKIALYYPYRASLDGELIRLKFKVSGSGKKGSTEIRLTVCLINGVRAATGKTTINITDKKHRTMAVELLAQPNPFNPSTKIYVNTTTAGSSQIKIFDMLGREVRQFEPGYRTPGMYEIFWDGNDNSGIELASGVYFVKYIGENEVCLIKIIKLK